MSLIVSEILKPLLAAPVAVFGAGRSGQAVLELLAGVGATGVVFDEKHVKNEIVNNFDRGAARRHRLVIFSPGFAPEHPWLQAARAAGVTCLGEIDFASLLWRGRVVAITGTNGKTTLTEFLTHALKSVGVEAYATGNIGFSFSRLVLETNGGSPDAVAICEISSFQAETLRHFRADTTLWTNFAEDHLERHPGMEAYFSAKWTLVERTAPGAVFAGTSVQQFARTFARSLPTSANVFSEVKTLDSRLDGTVFAAYPQHENYLLAAAWWQHAGRDEADLLAAARSFELGRHRLTQLATIEGVTWWNDSKATNFHAVEAALSRFSSPVFVILGGKSKGGDLAGFIRRLGQHVKHAFLLGETKGVLATFCRAYRVPHTLCEDLADTVSKAAEMAQPDDHVLLSPGFASFDLFRGYEDRGEQFEALVNNLGAIPSLR